MRKHVFVATPSHSGKVTVNYCQSLVGFVDICIKNKVAVTRSFITGNSFIADARNRCVRDFLDSDATDLLFIDDDIGFDPYGAYRLIQSKEDVIGGVYPQKTNDLVFNVGLREGCKTKGRLLEVEYIGAGLLKISRRAIKKMMEHYPKQVYRLARLDEGRSEDVPNLFGPEDVNAFQGEDVAFMKRWQKCGGKVWCDPDINFSHTGIKDYTGNFSDLLSRAPK